MIPEGFHQPMIVPELDEEDRLLIREVFEKDIAPRLIMMHARTGTINCEFAGERYKHWLLEFRSNRSGLDIVRFEYDPDSRSFPLPQPFSSRE